MEHVDRACAPDRGGSGANLLVALASLAVTLVLLVLCTGVGHTIDSHLPEEVSS